MSIQPNAVCFTPKPLTCKFRSYISNLYSLSTVFVFGLSLVICRCFGGIAQLKFFQIDPIKCIEWNYIIHRLMKVKSSVTSLIYQSPKYSLCDLEICDKIREPQNHSQWFENSHMDILEHLVEVPRYEKQIVKNKIIFWILLGCVNDIQPNNQVRISYWIVEFLYGLIFEHPKISNLLCETFLENYCFFPFESNRC